VQTKDLVTHLLGFVIDQHLGVGDVAFIEFEQRCRIGLIGEFFV